MGGGRGGGGGRGEGGVALSVGGGAEFSILSCSREDQISLAPCSRKCRHVKE